MGTLHFTCGTAVKSFGLPKLPLTNYIAPVMSLPKEEHHGQLTSRCSMNTWGTAGMWKCTDHYRGFLGAGLPSVASKRLKSCWRQWSLPLPDQPQGQSVGGPIGERVGVVIFGRIRLQFASRI